MIRYSWLGLIPYAEAWALQRSLFASLIADNTICERVLMCEHPPVITLGRHADPHSLLVSPDFLAARSMEAVRIERGGDVTLHAPGQLVVYPIISLRRHRLGVKDYVRLLEECVIRTIADFGVKGERVEGASGVWIGKGTPGERKICALGIKCSRFVTMHGLALNVCNDLELFRLINPCGFIDKGVTSLSQECGGEIPVAEVRGRLLHHLSLLLA